MAVDGPHRSPSALPRVKTRYPLYRRLGGTLGPVWTGVENLASTGIRSPDRPARSESLYGVSYHGSHNNNNNNTSNNNDINNEGDTSNNRSDWDYFKDI